MKKTLILIFLVVAACLLWYMLTVTKEVSVVAGSDPRSISYILNNQGYTLLNGVAEKEIAAGDSVKDVLRVFGEPVYGDLDGDGDEDAAVLLQNQPGGSGTFYYAVLAINFNGTFASTNALLLGDRIAPQTVEIHDGRAVYNYADRGEGEPLSTRPSIGQSLWVQYDGETGEISSRI